MDTRKVVDTTLRTEGVGTAIKEQSSCMLLKLSWYKSKLGFYNLRMLNRILMVATKKKVTEYILRNERRIYCTTKNQVNAKEDSNTGNEGQKPVRNREKKLAR